MEKCKPPVYTEAKDEYNKKIPYEKTNPTYPEGTGPGLSKDYSKKK